jgi:branched-chain amino acid aminotransferase
MSLYYINGKITEDPKQANISVEDRGFRFGDGIFDTISFYNKKIFLRDFHLERIQSALNAITIDFDINQLDNIFKDLLKKTSFNDGFIRVSITRGQGSRGYLPTYSSPPSLIIEVKKRPDMSLSHGDLTISTFRKIPKESIPVQYKLMQGMNSSLAKEQAKNAGFIDAVMLSIDNYICECSSANIFFFKDNILHTPTSELPLLRGVIRRFILEKNDKFDIRQGKYKLDDLLDADQVFITNTALKILPISKIDNNKFTIDDEAGGGKVEYLENLIESEIKSSCYNG